MRDATSWIGLAAVALGLMTGRSEADLVNGSTVDGTLTDPSGHDYFTTPTALVGGVGFSGPIPMSGFGVETTASFGSDTLTISFVENNDYSQTIVGFYFIYAFMNIDVTNGGSIAGLAAESGGDLPYQSSSFAGTTIMVNLDDTLFLAGNTTYSTTFDITTAAVAVPEPSSLALCGIAGVVGLAVARGRLKRSGHRWEMVNPGKIAVTH